MIFPPDLYEWRHGLHKNGGESLVRLKDGKIRGHAYKLLTSWWAIVGHAAIGDFASMEYAKAEVERKVMRGWRSRLK